MATFADDLKRIAMSAELAQTLSRAADYAHAQSHDQIQLEHLLLALTEDADAAVVLTASHVDAGLLNADVSQYLGGLTDRIAPSAVPLAVAPDLRRILEASAAAANQGRRRDINGAIVLAAIVGDGKSPSAHMLRAQGLTFEEAIRALQQTIAAPAGDLRPEPGATEDLLAAARARIHQTRGSMASRPVEQARRADRARVSINQDERAPPAPAQDWPPDVRASNESQFPPGAAAYSGDDPAGGHWQNGAGPGRDAETGHHDLPYEGREAGLVPAQGEQGPMTTAYPGAPYDPAGEQPAAQPHAFEAAESLPAPPRVRPAAPQPGTRWPAPVAPAWRDTEPYLPDGFAAASGPPPLPYAARLPDGFAGEPGQERTFELPGDAPAFDSHGQAPPGYGQDINPATPGLVVPAALPPPQTARGRRGRKFTDAVTRGLGEAIPRRMRQQEPVSIEASLPKAEVHALIAGLGGGELHAATVALSVRLRAPEGGFVIDPASSETQWFDARSDVIQSEHVLWHWTVTPLKAGRQRLQLVAAVRATGADGLVADHMLPDTVTQVRVKRRAGRVLLGAIKWIAVAGLGAGLAIYGPAVWATSTGVLFKLLK